MPAKKKVKRSKTRAGKVDDTQIDLLASQAASLVLKDRDVNVGGGNATNHDDEKVTRVSKSSNSKDQVAGPRTCSSGLEGPPEVWTSSRIKASTEKCIWIFHNSGRENRFMPVMLAIRDAAREDGPPSVILASSLDCGLWRQSAARLAPEMPVVYINPMASRQTHPARFTGHAMGSLVIMSFDAFRSDMSLLDSWRDALDQYDALISMGKLPMRRPPKPICLPGNLGCTCGSCRPYGYVVIDHRCATGDSQEDIEYTSHNCLKQVKICRP